MDAEMRELIGNISRGIEAYTYPLIRVDSNELPELIASCVFIEVKGAVYLVTAAHALRSENVGLLTRGNGHLIDIEGKTTVTRFPNKDNFDIATTHISNDLVHSENIRVIRSERFVTSIESENPHSRAVFGFPISMNKQSKTLDRKSKVLTGKSFGFFGKADFSGDYNKFDKSPTVHIGIEFKAGTDDKGRYISTPPWPPRGYSGGGSWLVPNLREPHMFFLEGIFIEGYKHAKRMYGFSTQLKHVVDFIDETHNKKLQSDSANCHAFCSKKPASSLRS
ncbi:MAG: hypothetical protein ABW185_01360 [Sedimenticola sp.]